MGSDVSTKLTEHPAFSLSIMQDLDTTLEDGSADVPDPIGSAGGMKFREKYE